MTKVPKEPRDPKDWGQHASRMGNELMMMSIIMMCISLEYNLDLSLCTIRSTCTYYHFQGDDSAIYDRLGKFCWLW